MSNPFVDIESGPLPHLQGPAVLPASPSVSNPPPVDEPWETRFKYGWRDVRHINADGEAQWIQAPLTRDDVLHPQEGDHQLHNDPHQVFCHYLYTVFKAQLTFDPTAVVFQDTGIFWDDPTLKHNSPDVTVILGVREQRDWTSFYVEEEGVRPVLAVEVTSPQAIDVDLVDKRQIYERARVPFYVIVETDPKTGTRPRRLIGYRLAPTGYVRMASDERGWIWLEPVRLFIGIQDKRVECYDGSGKRMGSYSEVIAELEAMAQARAAAEARAD
nr:Uma2 family endonuclease [Armatimonadota bacterium]